MAPTGSTISHHEAISQIENYASCQLNVEQVPLDLAFCRVAAHDFLAARDVPPCDNSAMDGFVIARGSDTSQTRFPIVDEIFAGDGRKLTLNTGEAMRIFTGAPVPAGAEFVCLQEECQIESLEGRETVVIPEGVSVGANIRRRAEDMALGDVVVPKGRFLRAPEVAIYAASGHETIDVFKKLRVGVFSTGDELVLPGAEAGTGKIYDANRYLLKGALRSLPVDIVDLGILPDDLDVVRSRLQQASKDCDFLLTSGGAGHGKADYVGQVLKELGQARFWQLAIKPGRPLMMGEIGNCLFMGLPGNPVAALISFINYARPLISARCGMAFQLPCPSLLPAQFSIGKRKQGRREFIRVRTVTAADGQLQLKKFKGDGSALLSSLAFADGIAILDEELSAVREGDLLPYISFSEVGLCG